MRPFDPFDPEIVANPYPWYAELRREGIHHDSDRDIWVLSRYPDVWAAARDHDHLSSAQGVTYGRMPLPMMLSLDPPDHTRLRRLVSRAFTPREIERRSAIIEEMTRALLTETLDTEAVDWVDTLAGPLPILVIADLIGIPGSDVKQFRQWSDAIIDGFNLTFDPEALAARAVGITAALVELRAYFDALDPDEAPDGSLLSILRTGAADERLDADELFWFFQLLLVAGNETTTNLLGNLVAALIDAPDQWQALRADPTIAPSAIEETLRFDSPIQGFYRTALDDVYIGGVTIPADARVLLLFGAANRDESHYPDASRFDVTRNPVDHLAFGNGIHHCLGAQLARLEGRIVLEELIRRVESVEAAGEGERTGNPTVRGYRRLPVRFQSA